MENRVDSIYSRLELKIRDSVIDGTIIMPKFIFDRSVKWCDDNKERSGIFVVKFQPIEKGMLYIIQSYVLLGIGTEYHVKQNKNRVKAFNMLMSHLRENSSGDFGIIEFHTHTVSTGKFWYDKFSPGDYESFKSAIKEDINYCHILITPENILINSNGIMNLIIKDSDKSIHKSHSRIFKLLLKSI